MSSRTRVDKFAEDLAATYGVEIVPDIPTLCAKVDGVLLESGDGRIHLQQAKQVIAAASRCSSTNRWHPLLRMRAR